MSMTTEEKDLYDAYKRETELVWEIAQRLDAFNPELPGSFTGNPSERIKRQLIAQNVNGFSHLKPNAADNAGRSPRVDPLVGQEGGE